MRFVLELVALVAIGYWGWSLTGSWMRFLLAIGLPAVAAAAWGVFRVPGDASASGEARVPVPGFVRLALEAAMFALAVWGLSSTGNAGLAAILAGAVVIHYAVSYDRIIWLLKR
jgi:hypothetical protein